MSNSINLTINASLEGNQVLSTVEEALKNIVSVFSEVQSVTENITQFTVQTTSDKLEHLYNQLLKSGLKLQDEAWTILSNAGTQYSIYRDIFINVNVHST